MAVEDAFWGRAEYMQVEKAGSVIGRMSMQIVQGSAGF